MGSGVGVGSGSGVGAGESEFTGLFSPPLFPLGESGRESLGLWLVEELPELEDIEIVSSLEDLSFG